MLLRHSFFYALARGIPGIVNFLAIAIYTRMMTPGEYGAYALVIAAVGLFDSVLFQWLRLGLLRFLPHYSKSPHVLLSTLFLAFLVVIAFTSFLGIAAHFIWEGEQEKRLLIVGLILLWIQGWYELELELARSQLAPIRYGIMSIFKSLFALTVGILFLLYGMGETAPLLGLISGMAVASLLFACREWRFIHPEAFEIPLLKKLLHYGLPMTATYTLAFLVGSSDRFMLGWFLGADAPGLYAPGYDLTQFSLLMLLTVVNLAAYPLVVRAMEHEGIAETREKLKDVLVLSVAVALPVATGLAVCSETIAGVMLGERYHDSASDLIPVIAVSSFLFGIKVFYLDLAFQLSKKTYIEPKIMLVAALVNVLLNLWWIPLFGLIGAASATVVAYGIGGYLAWRLGREVFPLPAPSEDVWKVCLISGIMGLVLWLTPGGDGVVALLGQVTMGMFVYFSGLLLLDVAGVRKMLLDRISAHQTTRREARP